MTSTKSFGITKKMVLEAYRHVRANQGAAGVDGQSLEMFEANLSGNLYKLWNRLASGSYFPPAVKRVEIAKKDGGVRMLGVPTVTDRIAQVVVKTRIEATLDPLFHPNSYGYRPGKSMQEALEVTRKRCWEYEWVAEFDVQKAFDELEHDLLLKALRKHIKERWALLYIERWLKAPVMTKGGEILPRDRGISQGGPLSPVLLNLFMHYAFDRWMQRRYPHLSFVRFADDALVHCQSESEAHEVLAEIEQRLKECGLRMHPTKSAVVCCKGSSRRGDYPRIEFTFLGFTFRPRSAKARSGKLFMSFLPAVSRDATKRMMREMRSWKLHWNTPLSLHALAERYNPILRGWLNYYGSFYRSAMRRVFDYFNQKLALWARRKYQKLRGRKARSLYWVGRIAKRQPRLFVHWLVFGGPAARAMGAV
ncbi:MAG: group II intron reverse transcriptase/maturase [Candidatus Udaeobacter sp.]